MDMQTVFVAITLDPFRNPGINMGVYTTRAEARTAIADELEVDTSDPQFNVIMFDLRQRWRIEERLLNASVLSPVNTEEQLAE